ncbi:MAG: tetratricopeptide repeat protein [Chloroflexi bacterium]|nr:tetratricopeptide repeat protein [Chloroflexota bacterium]
MSERNLIPDFIHYQFQQGRTTGSFEAATLFVDIAGFTPLTETLAQYHRDGAETLTDILTRIFQPHVREVYNRGGIIPFYAGDAFTAIFPYSPETQSKDEVVRQACQAAFTIQNYYGDHHVVSTKYGSFNIGVKIGLSVGTVEWGITGRDGSHQYYFRGAAIDACGYAEKQAATGQIITEAAFLDKLGDEVTAVSIPNTPYHQLKASNLTTPPIERQLPEYTYADLAPFIPNSVLDITANAEFREVAPVFISFEQSTNRDQFHTFVEETITLSHQYGGYFSQIDFGDKGGLFVILFGAPIAYENQVERAAEFLRMLQKKSVSIKWRAGITFGIVWAGIRGSQERCEYGAVGDCVNLAARLAMKADWGKIWVSQTVNSRLKQYYWLGALGDFRVKGKRENVSIYQLIHRKELSEDEFYTGKLIGRQQELKQLYATAQPIFEGKFAGLVYVHGDAGVGKSRLVHEFRRQLIAKYYPMTVFCPTEEILRTSLNPFKSFLRSYFRQSAEFSREDNRESFDAVYSFLLQQVPANHPEAMEIKQELQRTESILAAMVDIHWEGSLYAQLEPKLRFENTLSAFKTFIKAIALMRPVIIHIENGQWLDEDSHRMIGWLTRNISNYPIIMICVSRYLDGKQMISLEVDQDVPQHIVELPPLSTTHIQEITAQILQGSVSTEVVAFLTNKSDGNPFFLEQLVLDLYERGVLILDKKEGVYQFLKKIRQEEIPANINTILLSRLDRLENEVKQVVRTATVLGQEFELNILSLMLQEDPGLFNKVQKAEQKQVWMEKSTLRYLFQSNLLRDAAYSMQLRSRLRVLHKLAAAAIEKNYAGELEPFYADLAYHNDKAEQFNQAVHWYTLAGKRAFNTYANHEALTYFNRSLLLIPSTKDKDRYDVLIAREKIYALQGNRDAQTEDLKALQQIAKQLDDKAKQVEVFLRFALHSESVGDYQTAVSHAQNATTLAHEINDEQTEASAYLCWGRALLRRGHYEESRAQFNKALFKATGKLKLIEADGHRNLGVIGVDLGQYETAKSQYEEALKIYRDLNDKAGESQTINNLGVLSWNQGEYIEAQTYYQAALKAYRSMGYRKGELMVLTNLGSLFMAYGDYTNSITYNQSALYIGRETGVRLGQCYALLNLGLTYYDLHDDINAYEMSMQALQIAQEMGALRFQGYAWMNLGHVLLLQKELDRAHNAYQQAFVIWHELEQQNLEIEARAGLANVNLALGNTTDALYQVEFVLNYLKAGNNLEGTENPFQIYLASYEVLTAVQNINAPQILKEAYDMLHSRAEIIADKETRHAFLENVPIHRRLRELFCRQQSNS